MEKQKIIIAIIIIITFAEDGSLANPYFTSQFTIFELAGELKEVKDTGVDLKLSSSNSTFILISIVYLKN